MNFNYYNVNDDNGHIGILKSQGSIVNLSPVQEALLFNRFVSMLEKHYDNEITVKKKNLIETLESIDNDFNIKRIAVADVGDTEDDLKTEFIHIQKTWIY